MNEYEYETRAMGTDVSVSIIADDETAAASATEEALSVIREYDARFSRFIPESELSQLNRRGDMIVSEPFFMVLKRARELFIETGGVFNPLVQIARFGYDRDFDALDAREWETPDEPYDIDFTTMSMDPKTRRVVLSEGQQLDVGGFLKGYLAEKLARSIEAAHPEFGGVIVNIGGDLHTRGFDENGKPFVFHILNPILGSEYPLPLTNTSLATSGTYQRRWETPDGTVQHILRSDGSPLRSPEYISASIVHEDGAVTEAYAKLMLLLGPEDAAHVVPYHRTFKYLLVARDGTCINQSI